MEAKLACAKCGGKGEGWFVPCENGHKWGRCPECGGKKNALDARPIYIKVRESSFGTTIDHGDVIIDYGADGRVCGIEVLR